MIPILSVVGKSNSGKTTLIEKIIPNLKHAGFKIGVIKHISHKFNLDINGKDSYRHKKIGAKTVMLLSSKQMAMISDISVESLEDKLHFFKNVDIVITEGFKKEKFPKIEVFRPEIHNEPACMDDPNLLAIVSNIKLHTKKNIAQFYIDDILAISKFIENQMLKSKFSGFVNNIE